MYRLICITLALILFSFSQVFATPFQIASSTTLPVFIGYTGKPAGTSHLIQNLQEFDRHFGFPASYGDSEVSEPEFMLAYSLEMFWKNGGEQAQVLSLGSYEQEGAQKKAQHFSKGLQKLALSPKPQLLLLPDVVLLSQADYGIVCKEALLHAKKYGRFALLDVQSIAGDNTSNAAQRFRTLIAGHHLIEGAAYWPYVKLADGPWIGPSGLVAGRIVDYDQNKGVWKAPAGVEAVFAHQIQFQISQAEIESLQQDPTGLSINPLRSLPGKGIIIWGARTLAGNDTEWRYVPVRRFAILLDREVNEILAAHKSSPNTAATWNTIKKEIEALLMDYYRKGAFPASKASHAFFVKIGLRETMTQRDINQGNMIVELGFAPLKPAEFVVLKMKR